MVFLQIVTSALLLILNNSGLEIEISASPKKNNCIAPFVHTFTVHSQNTITQATIVCLTTIKTINALHMKTLILNYNGGDTITHSLIN